MKWLTIFILLSPTILCGQQNWEKTFLNGIGYSVLQNNNGGYTVTGKTWVDDTARVFLMSTNEYGDILWTQTYGGIDHLIGNSLKQTADGGYIITGTFYNSLSNDDVLLIKTNEYGDTTWVKTYGGIHDDYGYSVQQTSDGGYIITGTYGRASMNDHDVYLIKTDPNGDTLWTKSYGGIFYDCGRSVCQTTDGGYFITGYTNSGYYSYIYLIKTDEIGEILWSKTYKKYSDASGYSGKQTSDGGYIIVGYSYTQQNYIDVYLLSTDEIGDTLWTRTFGSVGIDIGHSVIQNISGGFSIAGLKYPTYSYYDSCKVFVINTDNNGDTLWTKTYSLNDQNIGYQIYQTVDGGFIITGSSGDEFDDFIYLIKTDSQGNIVWTTELPSTNQDKKLIKIIDLSGRALAKPIKNQPYIEIYDDETTKKKMIIK